MNREIKFRVWDKFNEHYWYSDKNKNLFEFFKTVEHFKEAGNDLAPEEQYTGLKDKNGKDIYEGDIIKSEFLRGYWYVTFKEGCYGLIKSEDDNPFMMGACNEDGATEIVGTNNQNPDFKFIDFPKKRKKRVQ